MEKYTQKITEKACPECHKGLTNGEHSKMDIIFCNALWQLKKDSTVFMEITKNGEGD